jgi:hypothetical protein
MLYPRLTECVNCPSACSLLADIDCKLFDMAKHLYNNVVFLLNSPISYVAINDLTMYKRILMYKMCNPYYAKEFSLQMIASRIQVLISK